jgi:hypothetical protein
MKITNQELHRLRMPQVIIEDTEKYICNPFGLDNQKRVDELNRATLESMYRVQDELYNLFGKCEMRETQANTINPAQQNVFIPLKTWIINLGGCFAEVKIQQRVLDGCFAEMQIL